MKRLFAIILITAMLVCALSFTAMAEEETQNMYTTQQVNMYCQPNSSSSVVQIIPTRSTVVSYKTQCNGFTDCFYGKKAGWISTEFLTPNQRVNNGGGVQNNLNGTYDQDMKLSQRTDVYSSPNNTDKPVSTLEALSTVHVGKVTNGWAWIDSNIVSGYVPTCYIQGWNTTDNYPAHTTSWYDGYDWSQVYDYEYFKKNNADVVDKYGDDPDALIKYFVQSGLNEGRSASPSFNLSDYMEKHGELYIRFGENLPIYYKAACGIPY